MKIKGLEKLKTNDLFFFIENAIANRLFNFTEHCNIRIYERGTTQEEILEILESPNKLHEKHKDHFDSFRSTWNYSIRSVDLDCEGLRIITKFNMNHLLIITVIRIKN